MNVTNQLFGFLKSTQIIVFLMLGSQIFGQAESIWFEDGATWHYTYVEGASSPSKGFVKLEVNGDTLISGKNYKVIKELRINSKGDTVLFASMCVRYDSINKKVFHLNNGEDNLLYDFSIEEKDTIMIKIYYSKENFDSLHLVIDSIGIEELPGLVQRRVQYCRAIDLFSWMFGGRIIEGIGSEMYLLPVEDLSCDAGCPLGIRCYQDSKLEINFNIPSYDCEELLNNINEKIIINEKVIIHPNPAKTEFKIVSKNQISNVIIYSSNGTMLSNFLGNTNSEQTISICDLNPGIYFVRVGYIDLKYEICKLLVDY